jgi:hypothetical protein
MLKTRVIVTAHPRDRCRRWSQRTCGSRPTASTAATSTSKRMFRTDHAAARRGQNACDGQGRSRPIAHRGISVIGHHASPSTSGPSPTWPWILDRYGPRCRQTRGR